MNFGYFDDKNREYVITDPNTPVKWINYIGTLDFGGFVDHTGGALICRKDPALNRITRYIALLPDSDSKGEGLYLRTCDDQGYQVFSPFFTPCLKPYDTFECRVGLGYNRITSQANGIECSVTIFVPRGADCEVRDIHVKNVSDKALQVDLIPVVEYTHFDALKQLTNADWVPQTMQSRLAEDESGLKTLVQYAFMRRETAVNYFTSNYPVSSFETDRHIFLGTNPLGNWASPGSLNLDELSNTQANRGDNIAALMHHLGELQPGETRRVITLLGQSETMEIARKTISRFRDPQQADEAQRVQAAFWQEYLSTFQVHTPAADFDRMLNVYTPRQCFTTLNWSRYLSLYQLGYGSRGIGFRDSAQDVMAVVSSAPREAKNLLIKLLSVQRRDGSAYHQLNPLSMVAELGDAVEQPERPQYYSDDHLWAVLAVCAYLKETGDLAFLQEEIPFYNKDQHDAPLETASVFEHLRRAVHFTASDLGAHGLPLLGYADWNDSVNLPNGAESLLTANLYGRALNELLALCKFTADEANANGFQAGYAKMQKIVAESAWDGEWYLAYFDDNGLPLGSGRNEYGQIYAYAQAWPVLSGFASADRAASALDAVHQKLNTRNGIKVSAPSFNGYDPQKGGVTTYPPGTKENGGIFLHVNPWVIIAETLLGHGDRAFEYYAQINPAGKNDLIDEYECEPFVYAQNILADEHPQFGLARNSWLSGTASWMYQAGVQWISGIRPTYQGLLIDPCIPADWDGFEAKRCIRGVEYSISVSNPQHVNKQVVKMVVDGEPISGNIVPYFSDGKVHTVEATLGNQAAG